MLSETREKETDSRQNELTRKDVLQEILMRPCRAGGTQPTTCVGVNSQGSAPTGRRMLPHLAF